MSTKKPTPKTQREISTSLVNPYDKERGDPNPTTPNNKNITINIALIGANTYLINKSKLNIFIIYIYLK